MNIYAIIPARGGSKGVPGKNTKLLNKKPLIAWTILAAKEVSEISRIIVNTDDSDIARVATEYGVEVFDRPSQLAQDLTEDLSVFKHHLQFLKDKGGLPDIVVDLRATAPLRGAQRIKQGIKLLINLTKGKADSVRAVCKATKHPYKMWQFDNDFIRPLMDEKITGMKEPYNAPRQLLPKVYQNNGCVNVFWSETVLEKNSMTGERIAGFVMEEWESVNIDTPIDFLLAETLMEDKMSENKNSQ